MAPQWLQTEKLSFNSLLLLERVQLGWLRKTRLQSELAQALHAHPVVAWYIRHKNPEIAGWVDNLLQEYPPAECTEALYAAEQAVLKGINDWLVYVVDPTVYDAQPFLAWDSNEVTDLVDLRDRVVLDIGAGTGRLALLAAPLAAQVYAVEPVENLRRYLRIKAQNMDIDNLFVVDGLATAIPFPDLFADVVLSGHVYGDEPRAERLELERVVRPGGMLLLCPGNQDVDNEVHRELVEHGYRWSRFEEPVDGPRRKYWKRISA